MTELFVEDEAVIRDKKFQGLVRKLHVELEVDLRRTREWEENKTLELIVDEEKAGKLFEKCRGLDKVGFDTETTGLDFRLYRGKDGQRVSKDSLVGVCVATDKNHGYYLPVGHKRGDNIDLNFVLEGVRSLLEAKTVLVMHNAQFDIGVLRRYGIDIDHYKQFEDTWLKARLSWITRYVDRLGLKKLAKEILGWDMMSYDSVASVQDGRKKVYISFAEVDTNLCYRYAAADSMATIALDEKLSNIELFKVQTQIYIIEKQFMIALRRQVQHRIRIDKDYLRVQAEKMEVAKIECLRKINEIVGWEINPSSPKQLQDVLYGKLELHKKVDFPIPKGKSGAMSTAAPVLGKLAEIHELPKMIVEYRSYVKDLGTYVVGMLEDTDEFGDVTVKFWQIGAETGRLSSSGGIYEKSGEARFAIMTIPKIMQSGDLINFRRAFIARPGYYFVKIDYSGEELRIWTNLSKEPIWTKMFLNNEDLHRRTGALFYNKPEEEVTAAERAAGKSTNFALIYGGSSYNLAQGYGIPIEEAEAIVGRIFGVLRVGRRWIDSVHRYAEKTGITKTYFGRIRPLPDAKSKEWKVKNRALRQACNTPIQGTGADIIKIAQIKLHKKFVEKGWYKEFDEDVRLLINVHDELAFEIREEKMDEILPFIMKVMESVKGRDWQVPLKVEATVARSWSGIGGVTVLYEEDKDGNPLLILESEFKKLQKEYEEKKMGDFGKRAMEDLKIRAEGKLDWKKLISPLRNEEEEGDRESEDAEVEVQESDEKRFHVCGKFRISEEDRKRALDEGEFGKTFVLEILGDMTGQLKKDVRELLVQSKGDVEFLLRRGDGRVIIGDDRVRVDPKKLVETLEAKNL